jgi:hypothetical protein
MEHALESFTVGTFTVKIYQDTDPESPREWSNLGTMVCWHRRYNLGDYQQTKAEYPDPESFHEYLGSKQGKKDVAVILPLYLYDHSGLRMSTGSFAAFDPGEWDSGQVGYIFVTRETLRKEYGKKRITKKTLARVRECLQSEVKAYDQYLSGDVYGFVVESPDGEHLDSCWGFFGSEYAKESARDAAQACMEQEEKTDRMIRDNYAL